MSCNLQDILISSDLIKVGEGGYGEVYTHPDCKNLVIKISKNENVCQEWTKEYTIQKEIAEQWNKNFSENVVIVNPYEFVTMANTCYIIMERICPLTGDGECLKNITGKTTHALFGKINYCKLNNTRGIFIGRNIIKDKISKEKLQKIIIELATFMSWMHYTLKLDAKDLEFIIGSKCGNSSEIKIYVIDFGMVDEFTISKAIESLSDVEYFPLLDACDYEVCNNNEQIENEILSKLFNDVYVEMSGNNKELALQILENM